MNRRWICSDVWMDILPSFDHAQLGLKMALLSDRFDILVDKHFDGKMELTIWREIRIHKDNGAKAELSVLIDYECVAFPFPDHPLPNKIRFKDLQIYYIDHSVLTFLRSNKQIWDRNGTKFELDVSLYATDKQKKHFWDVFVTEIWPIFATNIRHLSLAGADALNNLRSRTSPTILTDLAQLYSINSGSLLPDGIAFDGPNKTCGQALAKWLHTPTKNGQPNELRCCAYFYQITWINNFKETFLRATTSVAYNVRLELLVASQMNIVEQYELVNEMTQEKLTLLKDGEIYWLLKRCPIVGETTTVQQKKNENSDKMFIHFKLHLFKADVSTRSKR